MKIFVTGGAGFIGTNFIKYTLDNYENDEIVCADKLTYAGNYDNIKIFEADKRFEFVKADICDRKRMFEIVDGYRPDCIINFAAESHVDRSIEDPQCFLRTNTMGTGVLLDAAKEFNIKRFHQVSTDEVYGDLSTDMPEVKFDEKWALKPSSPYSVSKAAADMLVMAYWRTFKVPVSISRCSNNYGPYQFPEKLIPLIICNAREGKRLPVYGDGKNVRDWIYVSDHCRGVDLIVRKGSAGHIYNIGGNNERTNIEIVKTLLKILGKSEDLIEYVADRKGHDRRYAVCSDKIKKELGWQPKIDFDVGIANTVQWYIDNSKWLERIFSGVYKVNEQS